MLTKNQIKQTLVAEYPNLSNMFNIKQIGLFGSFAHGSAHSESDIDLIVEFNQPIGLQFIQLCDYLENIFHKKVDILTPEGLESIRIQSIKNNIKNTVEYVEAANPCLCRCS